MLFKIVVLWSLLLVVLFGKDEPQQQFIVQGYAQGTSYSIKYFAVRLMVRQSEIDAILLGVDSSMSLYKSHSLINRFNSSTKGLAVDRHFSTVIRRSFEIYKDTQGKFDVTVAPLVAAWGFGPQGLRQFPDSAAVLRMLENVGMNKLRLQGNRLTKLKPGVQIDLNGIAQGYTVDVVSAYLIKQGITSFVIEIGGELKVKGLKPDGTRRRIGLEGPVEHGVSSAEIRKIISFENGAVTTSGNYQKYMQDGHQKRSHLIDPKTGFPLDNQMISVTVFAKDAMTADGYDNALMAMTVPEALAFVKARKGMDAYMIYHLKDGTIKDTMTVGFKKMIVD